MEVHNSSPLPRPHIQVPPTRNGLTALPGANNRLGSTSSAGSSGLTSIDTGTTESLNAALSDSAGVRDSLVDDIKMKIEAGEYLNNKAVYEAAEAILNL